MDAHASDGEREDSTGTAGTAPSDPGHPDDPDHWRHETARINGIDLHCVTVDPDTDTGEGDNPSGDAPLVVLLHGFPEFWYAWRHQLDPLAEAGYRVVAPDLRGYNRTAQPEGVDNYRPDELVADVRGLVEHLGSEQAAVVGHDWGGAIAWEVGIRDPELVSQLAILNAPHPEAYRKTLSQSPRQLLKSWYVFFFQVPWLPERLLEADDYRAIEEMVTDTATPAAFSDSEIDRYKTAMARSGSLSGPINYYRAIARDTAVRQLRSLVGGAGRDGTVPVETLVVWGENDVALTTDLLDGLGEWVPDLRIERLPEASHWVQADDPGRVNDSLLDFLD